MDRVEIQKQLQMTYREQLQYLKQKYGAVPENYFLDVNCTRKSKKNSRTEEGLFVHHDFEYDPANPLVNDLGKKELAVQFDYMYQHAENLTYCNWLEHLMLHIKINYLRTMQLNCVIRDGVVNHFIPDLNDMYRYRVKLLPWQQNCFKVIEDNYDDYVMIVEHWYKMFGADPSKTSWKTWSRSRGVTE